MREKCGAQAPVGGRDQTLLTRLAKGLFGVRTGDRILEQSCPLFFLPGKLPSPTRPRRQLLKIAGGARTRANPWELELLSLSGWLACRFPSCPQPALCISSYLQSSTSYTMLDGCLLLVMASPCTLKRLSHVGKCKIRVPLSQTLKK